MDMFSFFILTLFIAVAVENLCDIFVTVPWFEPLRKWFETDFSKIKTLARCKYCQMFWMSGLASLFFIPAIPNFQYSLFFSWFITMMFCHKIAQFSDAILAREQLVEVTEEEPVDSELESEVKSVYSKQDGKLP